MASRTAAVGLLFRAAGSAGDERSDASLLRAFYAERDESAFAALVARHQRTVWVACARVLTDTADMEDAFQSTFVILARYGRGLGERSGLGGWLYRVAERVARRARHMATQRRKRERRAAVPGRDGGRSATIEPDLLVVVLEELDRLPDLYRLALLACDLDGLSRADAAARLGCAEGTLSARLHRGRKLLADRLRARGITAPLAGLGLLLAVPSQAPAGMPAATARLAATVAECGLTHRTVPATVAALVSHVSREMAMKIVLKAVGVAVLVGLGVIGVWVGGPAGGEGRATAAPVTPAKKEAKPELPDATLQFLRNRKVLKELGCTADQRVAISDHFDDQFEAAANRAPLLPPLAPGQKRDPQAERQLIQAKLKQISDAEAADTKAMAEKTLTAAQLTRLAQLDLQIRGAEALSDAKVAEALKLTDDQKKAAKDAVELAYHSGNADPFGPPLGLDGVRYFHLDSTQRKLAWDKATAGLSKEQLKVWETLSGEPAKTLEPYTIGGRGGSTNSGVQFRGR